jgi:hypothetical protein
MHQERVLFLPALSPEGDGMIKSEIWHEIHSRFKLKDTKKAIARTLGLSIRNLDLLRSKTAANFVETASRLYERERRAQSAALRSHGHQALENKTSNFRGGRGHRDHLSSCE